MKGEVSAVDARSRLKDMDLDTMLQRIEDVIQNRSEIDNLKSADIESLRKIRTDVQRCEFTLQ